MLHMPRLSNQYKKRGFLMLMPLLFMSIAALTFAYLLLFKIHHFAYALNRYEYFLKNHYEEKGEKELDNLYSSFDPYYSRKIEN
jgi:hypothetical protein